MFTLLTGGARSAIVCGGASGRDRTPVSVLRPRRRAMRDGSSDLPASGGRDDEWTTIEEPVELDRVLVEIDNEAPVIIGLALWVTNRSTTQMTRSCGERMTSSAFCADQGGCGHQRGRVGIVPVNLARRFQDLLGMMNQRFARGRSNPAVCHRRCRACRRIGGTVSESVLSACSPASLGLIPSLPP